MTKKDLWHIGGMTVEQLVERAHSRGLIKEIDVLGFIERLNEIRDQAALNVPQFTRRDAPLKSLDQVMLVSHVLIGEGIVGDNHAAVMRPLFNKNSYALYWDVYSASREYYRSLHLG